MPSGSKITLFKYLFFNLIFQLNSKPAHFKKYIYVKGFLCFDVKNPLLKDVQAL